MWRQNGGKQKMTSPVWRAYLVFFAASKERIFLMVLVWKVRSQSALILDDAPVA